MFKRFSAFFVLITLLTLNGCMDDGSYHAAAGGEKVFKIGVVTALSGPEADFGLEQKALLELRVFDLNAKNDTKIELHFADGQCDTSGAVQALKDLRKNEGIQFIIGGYCSASTLAMAPVAAEEGVLLLTATTTNPALENLSPNVFSLAYPQTVVAQKTLEKLSELERFATISENAEENAKFEQELDNLVSMEGKTARMVLDQRFDSTQTDFSGMMGDLEKSGAEALLLNPATKESALGLLRALEESGAKPTLVGTRIYNDNDLLAEAPELVNGMTIIDKPAPLESDELTQYLERLRTAEGTVMLKTQPYFLASSLDALDILAELVRDNNGDLESVLMGLKTGSFEGFLGKTIFNGKSFREGVAAAVRVVVERKV